MNISLRVKHAFFWSDFSEIKFSR